LRKKRTANTKVEKMKQPRATFKSVCLEKVICTSLHRHYQGGDS
jgi:hypothetical protein